MAPSKMLSTALISSAVTTVYAGCELVSWSSGAVTVAAPAPGATCLFTSNVGPLGVCEPADSACTFRLLPGSLAVHAHAVAAGSGVSYLWTESVPASAVAATAETAKPQLGASSFDVGILYESWHGFASHAMAYVQSQGGVQLSIEDVIRSNGNLTVADIFDRYGAQNLTDSFFYQGTPLNSYANPYYCIYQKRSNESTGWIPDCVNITQTLAMHATQLLTAGISYVVTDQTNLPTWSVEADVIQIRPLEVMFEVWSALRAAGTPTPYLTAWQTVPPGGTNWQNALALYNLYPDMVYVDPGTKKKVFFIPTGNADPTIIAAIESNGGRNDIVVIKMWAEFATNEFSQGLWAFFSPCVALDGDQNPQYTTSVVGLGRGASACGQLMTTNSAIGSALTVSPSLQLSYGSTPFSSTNKYDGLTLKRQFATLLSAIGTRFNSSALAAVPQHVFMSSWNEWIAQPQANPFNSPFAFSMGMPWDPTKMSLWVDTYGASLSRDLEPSTEYGTLLYDILSSCFRVAGAMALAADAIPPNSTLRAGLANAFLGAPGAACSVAGEMCCTYNDTLDGYAVVWAVTSVAGNDALLTGDPNELARITCAGCGWTQTCNPYGGTTDFCVDQGVLSSSLALQGPFVLHNGGCGTVASQAVEYGGGQGAGAVLPDRTPLYRCFDGSHHFFSTSALCGGATMESVLGCMHASRNGNMPRALRSCVAPSGMHYHVLDGDCNAGDSDQGVLGYVR